MSKEVLLRFAKGDKIEPKCICSFEIDRDTGGIKIHSCSIVHGLERSLFIRIVQTKEDLSVKASGVALQAAIDDYYKKDSIVH